MNGVHSIRNLRSINQSTNRPFASSYFLLSAELLSIKAGRGLIPDGMLSAVIYIFRTKYFR